MEVVRVLWVIMVVTVVYLFRMCSDRLDFVFPVFFFNQDYAAAGLVKLQP
mgnify:CR=1 FL=1